MSRPLAGEYGVATHTQARLVTARGSVTEEDRDEEQIHGFHKRGLLGKIKKLYMGTSQRTLRLT